ncbi:MAG: translation initiation factor IF-2 [Proteobacteria bacterium]|nr:MAG: translation initiation factor IF-2 [Pseudomonadota bacterium]
MSDVTVKQLAEVLGITAEKLMEQLKAADIPAKSETDTIDNDSKVKLLEFLRGAHGKDKRSLSPRKKVVLKRKSKEVLTVSSGSGISKTKNVNIEVKKKKRSLSPSQSEMAEIEKERSEARQALEERRLQLKAEEEAKNKAEQEKREAQEAAEREAEEARRQEAEQASPEDEQTMDDVATEDDVAEDLVADDDQEVAEESAASETVAEKDTLTEEQKEQQRREQMVDMQVKKAVSERAQRKRQEAEKPAKGRKGKKRGEVTEETRYGRKQLHVKGQKGRVSKKVTTSASEAHGFQKPAAPVVKTVAIPEHITVADLAKELSIKASDIIKVLMNMGMMVTINQPLDQDTAILVVEELGHKAEEAVVQSKTERLKEETEKDVDSSEAETRPPVVTVMGHVDHGKTSLLDYIRKTKVTGDEAGGITQHIGAYHVKTPKGVVSFIDTPGHAAFTAMRARGAQVTDLVILVVAANDSVMPQTKEAIDHAQAAGVPMIVAINKIDLPEANVDKVKQDLAAHEVVPEDWGGDTQFIEVSAHTGQGIDELLEAISLQAEVMELTAVKDTAATGIVVESSLDKGRGPVATVLVKGGTLRKGDMILCGEEFGRIRSLIDENGQEIESAGPSIPAVVLGLSGVPLAGDEFLVVKNKKEARDAAQENREQERETRLKRQQAAKLENLMSQMGKEERLIVNIVVKADVQGSVEALKDSLENISNDEVEVKVISSGVGGINNADAQLAAASNAIIIGFNVRADKVASETIKESDLDLHYFSIIYEAIDQVKAAVTGALGTETKEQILGTAEVRDVFR